MKIFKRTGTFLLALWLILGTCVCASAASAATLRVTGAAANPGERVDIAVQIANNPGVTALILEIEYDDTVLTLESVRDGGLLGTGTMTSGGDLTAVPFKVLWVDSLARENYTQDGTLVIFTFAVREDAESADIPITLTCKNNTCFDCDLNVVNFVTESGVLSVHRHTYTATVTEPTCTAKGYTTYTCSTCGDTYTADETAMKAHEYAQLTVHPDCTHDGYVRNTCTVCGDTFTETIPTRGHAYNTEQVEPTCTTSGGTFAVCSVCGDRQTVAIADAWGHRYGAWQTVVEATQTQPGLQRRTCINCDAFETRQVPILPTVTIRNFAQRVTVEYRTTAVFTAEVTNGRDGAEVHWFINGADQGVGETYTVKEAKKDYTVQIRYILDGDVIAQSQTQTVQVKTGFFAKLKAFFRALFKKLPVLVQEYIGIEKAD